MEHGGKCRFSIDRGGTFTDIFAEIPTPPYYRVLKLLSVDPANYDDAPREGIRRILQEVTGTTIPKGSPIPTAHIESIRMGTTIATNALLERNGVRIALVTTKGFGTALKIGNQSRPHIFDLSMRRPPPLYETVVELEERVRVVGSTEADSDRMVVGVTGERIEVLQPLEAEAVRAALQAVYAQGIRSLAVVFLHSYTFHDHEKLVARIAYSMGFTSVSLSCEVMPMVKFVPRGQTTCVDAYLTPLIKQYIDSFAAGFEGTLRGVNVSFMMSDGGVCPMAAFLGSRAILSGPAGGVVGYVRGSYATDGRSEPLIGLDMGGTSTDVSRYADHFEHVFEASVGGVQLMAPQLDINTVAAGGGSRLFFRSGLFVVGPESSGADPGPLCYRKKGGMLALTDANVLLGRLVPEFFPKIFGPSEREPLDDAAPRRAFEELAGQVNEYLRTAHPREHRPAMSVDEVAYGFVRVANEAMARPIRALTMAKGFDTAGHVLCCFGGAGGQHACALARLLGMKRVLIHRFSGILSAYGLALADVVVEKQEPAAATYDAVATLPGLADRLARLELAARAELAIQGFPPHRIAVEHYLNLRFEGTDVAIMTPRPDPDGPHRGDYAAAFVEEYQREFGFVLQGRAIVVDDVRVRAVGQSPAMRSLELAGQQGPVEPAAYTSTYFEESGGRVRTPIYQLGRLGAGAAVSGPAILIDDTATIVVAPDCTARVTAHGLVAIEVGSQEARAGAVGLDPVLLSVFGHRFMSIAEQMGRTLQRTSISTNIKERLDFSCALFGPDGGLVANAPHLPVHLGAMQEAVKWQMQHLGGDWKEGDVIVTNHPVAGGSHLPDITVITPVFNNGKPVFYVASRGHHADIGGISPGSMPPFSHTLAEEGATIKSFKLVSGGVFNEQGITDLLMAPAAIPRKQHEPPSSGSRNLRDNLSDLRAQVAANQKGISLVQQLIAEYGLEVVLAYMNHVMQNAEEAVRDMLRQLSIKWGLAEVDAVSAEDFMDDGTPIRLRLTIDRRDGSAVFDFTGTGAQSYGNCNAPRSVTKSAIIYCLRCLVSREIPLNQGCLVPISIVIPDNSILSPGEDAAVVGGNVLTSQRVTDVILAAFRAAANSQGCMNNLTFGSATLGYYETIAGGGGAGPGWHGESGVHSHMTNTRITDAEILERRYPVLLRQFSIRRGSGGEGQFRGGDGVIRELEFLAPLTVGILSERRAFAPRGLEGGKDGARGVNYLYKKGLTYPINLGAKCLFDVAAGDRVQIITPGGGGFGTSSNTK